MGLSTQQKSVITTITQGKNVFITGPGGTGKTHLIKHIVTTMSDCHTIFVCALTGVAGELLGCDAKTIHSWSGTGKANSSIDTISRKVMRNKVAKNNWKKCNILIVDEVSMMSEKYFEILDIIGRLVRKIDKPFGGIQLVFSGDFHQLPPIGEKGKDITHNSHRFCFQSELWNQLFPTNNVFVLSTFYRQKDPLFTKILMQIRKGKISRKTNDILQSKIQRNIQNTKNIPILSPLRNRVNIENDKNMKLLQTSEYKYPYKVIKTEEFYKDLDELPASYIKNEINRIKSEMNADEILTLKVGAHVMCVANIDMKSSTQIVNGSQGKVIDITVDDIPIVQFNNGVIREMNYHTWSSEDIPGLGVQQIPLILSWAVTIHKAQGITLDSCIADVGHNIFEYGQTYVALSRVKTLDGLILEDYTPHSIRTNPDVQEYYKSLG